MANEKTVLICDTDNAQLQEWASSLVQSGFNVTTLSNGGQVAQVAAQGNHAVIVVNPDMQGFDADALCKLKQDRGFPVVLLLEAQSTSRNILGACAADDVVEKPVHVGNLTTLLNKQYTWNKAVKE